MSEQDRTSKPSPESGQTKTSPTAVVTEQAAGSLEGANAPEVSKTLTAEEQMALYEKALKEDDWGHQPC
jgi:hypothetical protein